MKKTLINQIQTEMSGVLNNAQRQKLSEVLEHCFFNVDVVLGNENLIQSKSNLTLKEEFLSAKQVEGCSERSVNYYSSTLDNLIKSLEKPFNQIETEDLLASGENNLHESGGINQKKSKEKSHYQF